MPYKGVTPTDDYLGKMPLASGGGLPFDNVIAQGQNNYMFDKAKKEYFAQVMAANATAAEQAALDRQAAETVARIQNGYQYLNNGAMLDVPGQSFGAEAAAAQRRAITAGATEKLANAAGTLAANSDTNMGDGTLEFFLNNGYLPNEAEFIRAPNANNEGAYLTGQANYTRAVNEPGIEAGHDAARIREAELGGGSSSMQPKFKFMVPGPQGPVQVEARTWEEAQALVNQSAAAAQSGGYATDPGNPGPAAPATAGPAPAAQPAQAGTSATPTQQALQTNPRLQALAQKGFDGMNLAEKQEFVKGLGGSVEKVGAGYRFTFMDGNRRYTAVTDANGNRVKAR